MLRMLTSGESHGPKIAGILDGIPAGLKIDMDYLRGFMARRRGGYGRGKRMSVETDEPVFSGGVHDGFTTGAPIMVELSNRADNPTPGERYVPRPGHADYVGYIKYGLKDLNIVAERASARETAIRTLLGAICSLALRELNIEVFAFTRSIGKVSLNRRYWEIENLLGKRDNSVLYCPDEETTQLMIREIEDAKAKGDSLGGSFTVVAKNVPPGLGSYVQWDRRLDAALGFSLLSIPSVKAVEIGEAIEGSRLFGSEFHDRFVVEDGVLKRSSNNAGGIEGGVSNGEDIVLTAYLKPIPSSFAINSSIDLVSLKEAPLPYVRSDTVVVPAASVVGEAMVSFTILCFLLEKFGGDEFTEIKERVEVWRRKLLR